jgi:hypothetical protein
MPLEIDRSYFDDDAHYDKYLKKLDSKEKTETCKKYPAGRNKTLIIKTVSSRKKPKHKNDRRLCLTSIVSNPKNITLVALKQTDKNFSLWMYPEGRRLNSDEEENLLSSLLAWRKFKKNMRKVTPKVSLLLGITHVRTKYTTMVLKDKILMEKINFQYRRILRKYTKLVDEYCGDGEEKKI